MTAPVATRPRPHLNARDKLTDDALCRLLETFALLGAATIGHALHVAPLPAAYAHTVPRLIYEGWIERTGDGRRFRITDTARQRLRANARGKV